MIINQKPLNHKKCLKKLRLPVHKCDILWLHSYYIASLKNSVITAVKNTGKMIKTWSTLSNFLHYYIE